MVVEIFAGAGLFRGLFARHRVLFRRKFGAPYLIGFTDLVQTGHHSNMLGFFLARK